MIHVSHNEFCYVFLGVFIVELGSVIDFFTNTCMPVTRKMILFYTKPIYLRGDEKLKCCPNYPLLILWRQVLPLLIKVEAKNLL